MRLPLVAILAVAAAGGAAPARADAPADFWQKAPLERRALGTTERLVVSTEPAALHAVVCVGARASASMSAVSPIDEGTIARRGGVVVVERALDVSLWCVRLPGEELAYGLWLAGAEWRRAATPPSTEPDRSEEPPPEALRDRARSLALEGTAVEANDVERVITVVGSAGVDAVSALATRFVGPVSAAPAPRALAFRQAQTTERFSVMEGPAPSPLVRYAWAVPRGTAGDRAALALVFDVLAGCRGSRLVQDLVARRGMAHQVSPWALPVDGGDVMGLSLELGTRTNVDRVRRFVDGALKQLRLVGPSRRELGRARARLTLDALRAWEDLETRARRLAIYEMAYGDAGRLPEEAASLDRATPEDVRRAAHDELVDRARTTVELYPHLWPEDDPRLSRYELYTVAPGDALADVATRFHVPLAALARANDLDPKRALTPGQPLWVPPPAPPVTSPTTPPAIAEPARR